MNVGAWMYFLSGMPKHRAGPRWNGVKGMLQSLLGQTTKSIYALSLSALFEIGSETEDGACES